jgi:5'-methylthioadenosine phosphorylase
MTKKFGIAVIGGSGIYDLDNVQTVKEHIIDTPFGSTSDAIIEAQIDGATFYFLSRHGRGHTISPSEINFRANIYALKTLGVTHVLSVSAVGSLKEELPPGTFVLVDQFIDWTKGLRERTFFGEGVVGHVSTALPVELNLQQFVGSFCKKLDIKHEMNGSYVCIEGPQFSTKAESAIYRSFGASVIGMTNVPEAYLAKEAGMAYSTVAMVTDYDCWKEEHCSIEEIIKVMTENSKTAKLLLSNLIPALYRNPTEFELENQFAVITSPEKVTETHKKIVDTLLS